jgi:hypothetical protein
MFQKNQLDRYLHLDNRIVVGTILVWILVHRSILRFGLHDLPFASIAKCYRSSPEIFDYTLRDFRVHKVNSHYISDWSFHTIASIILR